MKSIVIAGLFVTTFAAGAIEQSQAPTARQAPSPLNNVPVEIPLWEGGAPGALGDTDADKPTLTIYRAARVATGTGVVVAPGGGYTTLAMDHEGRQVASWFNAMGISAFVLKDPTRAEVSPSDRAR